MALKRPSALLNLPTTLRTTTCLQCRYLHRLNAPTLHVPKPTPFVPDVPTFLTLIGRNLNQHSAKIPTWKALFTNNSEQFKESGIEPARARRYLLWWRERFRNGIVGIGGDLQHVENGSAELRIVEVASERSGDRKATLTKDPGVRKMVINTPQDLTAPVDETRKADKKEGEAEEGEGENQPRTATGELSSAATATAPPPRVDASQATPVLGLKIHHGSVIGGRGVKLVKGHQGVAVLKVEEGLWEQKRGHKVDGGERFKASVRAKRRLQERKMAK